MDNVPEYPKDPYFDDSEFDSYYDALLNDNFEKFKEIIVSQGIEDEELAWQIFAASRRDITSIERTYSNMGFTNSYNSIRHRSRYIMDPNRADDDDFEGDEFEDELDMDAATYQGPISGVGLGPFGLGSDDLSDGDFGGDLSEAKKALDFNQRRKRAMVMKRMKARLKVARRLAANRTASTDKIKLRAKAAARNLMKKKMAGQKNYSSLTTSQKQAVDKRFARVPDAAINRMAMKLMPQVRKREAERMKSRLSSYTTKNESVEEGERGFSPLHSLIESTVIDLQERGVMDLITFSQVKSFEKVVDSLFKKYGIDFNFTKHFAERISDSRNTPAITLEELAGMFKKIYSTVKTTGNKTLSKFGDVEAVLKDLQTDINIPVAIEYDRSRDDLTVAAKTIMRKKMFKTPDPVIKV